MSEAARVLIADDHAPTRAGLRETLAGAGYEVVGEAHDAESALRVALETSPDLVLVDINMPGNGITAAAALRERLPGVRIVMLTVSRSDADFFAAIRAGASGYLIKDVDPDRLTGELRRVLDGDGALSLGLVGLLIDEFRRRERRSWLPLARDRGHELTSREGEVLQLLGEGLGTAEIGDRLFIAPTTVRRHVGSILKKLGVPDREAAVRVLERRSV